MRPLISTADPKKSVDISRRAELYETSSGLVTITGGKLTTWRRMAKMAVDRIVEREGREAPCRTHEIPLGQPVDPATLPNVASVDEESRAHLAARYGHAAVFVLRLVEAAPSWAGGSAGAPDILAEAHSRPRTSRRSRSATCSCVAPGSVCSTRAPSLLQVPRARGRSPWRWRPNWAGTKRASRASWTTGARSRESRGARRAGAGRHRSGRVILRLRERALDLGEPVLMGILNATPDSFSTSSARKTSPSSRNAVTRSSRKARRSSTSAASPGAPTRVPCPSTRRPRASFRSSSG